MPTKICPKCGQEKDYSEFHKDRTKASGYVSWCKICKKETREHKYNKERYKRYYQKNKERISKRKRKYYQKNKEKISKYMKEYNQKNKSSVVKKKQNDNKFRRAKKSISRRIRKSIRNKSRTNVFKLLGYTRQEFIEHLTKTMPKGYTWEDYGEKLHIDHIICHNLYNYESCEDEDFKKCWDLRNLRLLEANKNMKRSRSLDVSLVKEYNIEDLLPKGYIENT